MSRSLGKNVLRKRAIAEQFSWENEGRKAFATGLDPKTIPGWKAGGKGRAFQRGYQRARMEAQKK